MKYYGKIGFMWTEEADPINNPSVYSEHCEERVYSGEHLSTYSGSWRSANKLNDDKTVNAKISILADPFARDHFTDIRYIEWLGKDWKVSNVEVQFPRLILTVGEVYNKPEDDEIDSGSDHVLQDD